MNYMKTKFDQVILVVVVIFSKNFVALFLHYLVQLFATARNDVSGRRLPLFVLDGRVQTVS